MPKNVSAAANDAPGRTGRCRRLISALPELIPSLWPLISDLLHLSLNSVKGRGSDGALRSRLASGRGEALRPSFFLLTCARGAFPRLSKSFSLSLFLIFNSAFLLARSARVAPSDLHPFPFSLERVSAKVSPCSLDE